MLKIFGEVLCHFCGQRGHQYPLVFLCPCAHLTNEVIHLPFDGTHLNFRVNEPGGADELLGDLLGMLLFVFCGGGRHKDGLIELFFEFVEIKGAVVISRGQTEAEFHQILLSCGVSSRHAAHLGNGHMGFVHEKKKIIGEKVKQGVGGGAGGSARQHAGIVFHPGAEADLAKHLHIVVGALFNALCFDELSFAFKEGDPLLHFPFDFQKRLFSLLGCGNIVRCREDGHIGHGAKELSR